MGSTKCRSRQLLMAIRRITLQRTCPSQVTPTRLRSHSFSKKLDPRRSRQRRSRPAQRGPAYREVRKSPLGYRRRPELNVERANTDPQTVQSADFRVDGRSTTCWLACSSATCGKRGAAFNAGSLRIFRTAELSRCQFAANRPWTMQRHDDFTQGDLGVQEPLRW
jgi:hypothetical protein